MRRIYKGLAWSSGGMLLLTCLLALTGSGLFWLFLPLTILVVAVCGRAAWILMRAMTYVLESRSEQVRLFWGLIQIVAWSPIQGVVILKNKKVSEIADDSQDGGGIALLFPPFGEEVALRVPLDIQTLSIHDRNVYTSELVPIEVRGTVFWRITNLGAFYARVGEQIHQIVDEPEEHTVIEAVHKRDRKLEAAEQWLRYIVEETTRGVVARQSTGLLFGEQIANSVRSTTTPGQGNGEVSTYEGTPQEYRRALDGLSAAIHASLHERVGEYGIEVHRVGLREVIMPQEIWQGAVQACSSAYQLIEKQRSVQGRRIELETEVGVLGRDSVAFREVLSQAPEFGAMGALAPIIHQFFTRMASQGGMLGGAPTDPALPAAKATSLGPNGTTKTE